MKIVYGIATTSVCMMLACASTKPASPQNHAAQAETPCAKELTDGTNYGEPMKLAAAETTCIKTVFGDRMKYDGKNIRVAGLVDSVCAKKGCWMRLTDDKASETLFVKFTCPVAGRLVPMDAVGKRAVVEGTLEVATMSEAEARHYKEDAGATPEEVQKVVGPQKVLRMKAPAAMIENRKAT